jgi:DNA-binding NarL/FixJ family response regulator
MAPEQIVETIRRVHAGKRRIPPEIASHLAEHLSDEPLSNREVEVLRLVCEGNANRDIAEALLITEETVKVHLKHITKKPGATDRTQAVTIAARRGCIRI